MNLTDVSNPYACFLSKPLLLHIETLLTVLNTNTSRNAQRRFKPMLDLRL